jgi:hypothetical protein
VRPRSPLAVVLLLALISAGCSSGGSVPAETGVGSPTDCGAQEPANPYDDGSGHHAGFEWAERNDPGVCGGNSTSFIDGCEEFLRQAAAYQTCASKR